VRPLDSRGDAIWFGDLAGLLGPCGGPLLGRRENRHERICESGKHERDRTWPGSTRQYQGQGNCVVQHRGHVFALENACTHEEGPLAEGEIEGYEVTCPWHGARFDVRTGEALCAPAYEDVVSYNVRVIGTDIEIEV
jgi:3-phenylpropionate/trans-cinnamate dioxygenase ferredoxin component